MSEEEYAQRLKEQAITNNDAWQLRNIEQYLQPYVEFCKQRNIIGAQKAMHDYTDFESKRLKVRADLMERYSIERLPNRHRDKAVACLDEAKTYIDANVAYERERCQSHEKPQVPVQADLWQMA